MKKTFSIKASLRRGWEFFRAHALVLSFAVLVIMLIGGGQGSPSSGRQYALTRAGAYGLALQVALFAIGVIVEIGWIKMLLIVEDGGRPDLRELVSHANRFFKFLAVYILFGIGLAAGTVLFVVPGIYFLVTYQYAIVIAADKDTTIAGAFKESARITKGAKWKLLGFLCIAILLNILGAVLFVVGLLATVPVTLLAMMHIYRTLGREAAPSVVQTAP